MTDNKVSEPKRGSGFVQSNFGSALVGGIIAAVFSLIVAPFVNAWLNALIKTQGVVPAAITVLLDVLVFLVAFGLTLFVLFSLINRRARRRVWGWTALPFRAGLRVTTAKQRDRETMAAVRLAIDNERAIVKAEAELQKPPTQADHAASLVQAAQAALATIQKTRGEDDFERPKLPRPMPRWMIWHEEGDADDEYRISNAVPRSVALEVRVESDADFEITDAGHWADLSGDVYDSFYGNITDRGEAFGVIFYISWYDENGAQQHRNYTMPGDREPDPDVF